MADILVVDDDPLMVELIESVLSGKGHEVRTVESGLDALREFRGRVPDLVLLDMNLPEMDGYAVAKSLRFHSSGKTVPILAVTAHSGPVDYDAAYAAGCTGFLGKPLSAERLVEAVDQQLKGK